MQQRGEAMYPTGIPNSQDYCKTLLEAIGGKYVNTSITTKSWKLWHSLYPFHFLCYKLPARRLLFWFYLPTHCSPFSTWFWCCPIFQNTLFRKKKVQCIILQSSKPGYLSWHRHHYWWIRVTLIGLTSILIHFFYLFSYIFFSYYYSSYCICMFLTCL